MNAVIDQRTGLEVARFATYTEAANYRRDVLQTIQRYTIRGVAA